MSTETIRAYPPGVDYISGFGGFYEQGCQVMVLAGMKWFDEHPDADPHFKGYEGIFGVLTDDNDDAKGLTKAMVDAGNALEGGVTGAMHRATVSHVLAARRLGWDEYLRQLADREANEVNSR